MVRKATTISIDEDLLKEVKAYYNMNVNTSISKDICIFLKERIKDMSFEQSTKKVKENVIIDNLDKNLKQLNKKYRPLKEIKSIISEIKSDTFLVGEDFFMNNLKSHYQDKLIELFKLIENDFPLSDSFLVYLRRLLDEFKKDNFYGIIDMISEYYKSGTKIKGQITWLAYKCGIGDEVKDLIWNKSSPSEKRLLKTDKNLNVRDYYLDKKEDLSNLN